MSNVIQRFHRQFKSVRREFGALATQRPVVRYVGWLGHHNLGDEAIRAAADVLFQNKIYFYEKGYVGKGLRLKWREQGSFAAVMLGGGTLVNRDFHYLIPLLETDAARRVIFACGVADPDFLAEHLPSYDRGNIKRWVAAINDNIDDVSVRGPRSRQILLEYGVRRNIDVVGDPVLAFCEDRVLPRKKTGVLAVNLGHSRNFSWGRNDAAFLGKMRGILIGLAHRGWQLHLLPVWIEDVPILKDIQAAIGPAAKVIWPRNARQYMEQLRNVDVLIGEKLHAAVLAACVHTPALMLEYRPKCRDFMASLDLESYTVKITDVSTELIASKLEGIQSNYDYLRNKIFERGQYYKARLAGKAGEILRSLGVED